MPHFGRNRKVRGDPGIPFDFFERPHIRHRPPPGRRTGSVILPAARRAQAKEPLRTLCIITAERWNEHRLRRHYPRGA